jgi:hypothetical protein
MDFPEDQHGPCVKDLKQMNALNTNPAELCKAYAPTPQSVFDTMSPEELNIYTDRKLQYAYKNNNNLRNEGGNVMDALKLFSEKQTSSAVAIAVCRNSENMELCENSAMAMEAAIGLRGSDNFFKSNTIACDLLRVVTGIQDPFEQTSVYESKIKKNLESYPLLCSTGKKGQTTWIVSNSKKKEILDAVQEWMSVDPCFRSLYRQPRMGDMLTVKKAITLLNHILHFQFAVAIARRDRKQKRTRGAKPDHVYFLSPSGVFQEYSRDTALTKPVLVPWNKDSACIQDEEILKMKTKYNKTVVAPGNTFQSVKRLKLDAGDQEHGYRPVMQQDILGGRVGNLYSRQWP